ncbi:hypothetical protein B0H19DRAFT_1062840 [Mycena capillaripes]|nr:hypothetical protein B0H19DRAFT_1062840 [Mycena capillaripes]
MYTSNSTARGHQSKSPFEYQRRTLVACSNCRQRKIKCVTREEIPKTPCARCTKKGLLCEYALPADYASASEHPPAPPAPDYVAVQDYLSAHTSPNNLSAAPMASGGQSHPSMQVPAWASQPMLGSNSSSHGLATAPPLPYTGPPPPFQRPRYSGYSEYPDLSLHESSQGNTTPQYHPTMTNQGYNPAHRYMNSAAAPGAQQPGSTGYPAGYEQTQYYVDGLMPTYEWLSEPGSGSQQQFPGISLDMVGRKPYDDTAVISQLNDIRVHPDTLQHNYSNLKISLLPCDPTHLATYLIAAFNNLLNCSSAIGP